VTGNDAELAAIQRVISGDQYNTISKPIKTVAEAAAQDAYAFVKGTPPEAKDTLFDTPSQLFVPTVVTKENVAATMFGADGPLKAAEVCAGPYQAACAQLGIK
jgi:simple sugar transport system substrate-binding protein/D-xylose transport system substrate-binding protein